MSINSQVFDRGYAGLQDLQAMINLIKERSPDQVTDFPSLIDLQEMLATSKIQAATHLWADANGRLVGFVILDWDPTSALLIFEVAADWKEQGLEVAMCDWAGIFIQKFCPVISNSYLLETSARSDNLERLARLQGLGFKPQAGGSVQLERSLNEPIDKPQLPSGFFIRCLKGEMEAEAWVKLHRLAHGTENMTVEYKLAMMRTPSYEPDLDLVAVTTDGALAAYCVCFISIEENALTGVRIGYTDPIATHPDFQKRGLSKALILTGLYLLKERGMEYARLGTSSDNIAMIRTAESVGFHIKNEVLRFGKPIHFG